MSILNIAPIARDDVGGGTMWRQIPSFPRYEASEEGDIRLIGLTKSGAHYRTLTPFLGNNTYLRVGLSGAAPGESVHRLVSVLVCEAFRGPPPTPHHQAAHENGVRVDNRESNLRWKTRHENYQDQIRHGTSKQGSGHHLAKLDEERVRDIRRRAADERQSALAREFAVSAATISQIVSRKSWSHI